MKRSVLERKKACMGNVLIINGIGDKRNWMRIMKYFNIWMGGRRYEKVIGRQVDKKSCGRTSRRTHNANLNNQ